MMYTFRSDKIIILDTEYTSRKWAQEINFSGPHEFPEIIQIAAIIIDTKTFEELDSFVSFVKPQFNPILSDYIKNLTHITQEQVDTAEDFITVMKKFSSRAWDKDVYSYGNDGIVIAENYWLHKINFPFRADMFQDVREIFRAVWIPAEKYMSWTINEYFNIENPDQAHDALDDSRNILRAMKKLYLI